MHREHHGPGQVGLVGIGIQVMDNQFILQHELHNVMNNSRLIKGDDLDRIRHHFVIGAVGA